MASEGHDFGTHCHVSVTDIIIFENEFPLSLALVLAKREQPFSA